MLFVVCRLKRNTNIKNFRIRPFANFSFLIICFFFFNGISRIQTDSFKTADQMHNILYEKRVLISPVAQARVLVVATLLLRPITVL